MAAAALSLVRSAAILLVLLVVALVLRLMCVTEESLTAISGSGIRVCTKHSCGMFKTSRFIEAVAIADIFIAEAVRLDHCHFYLAVLLHTEEPSKEPEIVVPFRHLIPRLRDLQVIHAGTRMAVWGAESAERLNSRTQKHESSRETGEQQIMHDG